MNPGAFLFGEIMEKTERSKEKDRLRTEGKIWVDEHTPYEKRTTGSGMTFSGKYKKKI